MIAHRAPLNAEGAGCETPLHCAAITGNVACVRILLAAEARSNAQTVFERTPLHYATLPDDQYDGYLTRDTQITHKHHECAQLLSATRTFKS